jgi:hypothetical protein
MRFAHAPDSEYAPYLLDFRGTPAERHVENLKVHFIDQSTLYCIPNNLLDSPGCRLLSLCSCSGPHNGLRCRLVPPCIIRDPATLRGTRLLLA